MQLGLFDAAELMGERTERRRRPVAPASPRQKARRTIVRGALAQPKRAAEWQEGWYVSNDFIRHSHHAVRQARRLVTALGPDHARTWSCLALAAHVEGVAHAVEAELDGILASGRITAHA